MELLKIDLEKFSVEELVEKRNQLNTMLRRPVEMVGHDKKSLKNAILKIDLEIKSRGGNTAKS